MIETPARPAAHDLGPADRIPIGEGRTFLVGSTAVAVFRTRTSEVFATQASCPHKEGPLADGIVGAGILICPLHAYRFELATGRPAGNNCAPLRTYAVSVVDGRIALQLDDPSDAA